MRKGGRNLDFVSDTIKPDDLRSAVADAADLQWLVDGEVCKIDIQTVAPTCLASICSVSCSRLLCPRTHSNFAMWPTRQPLRTVFRRRSYFKRSRQRAPLMA